MQIPGEAKRSRSTSERPPRQTSRTRGGVTHLYRKKKKKATRGKGEGWSARLPNASEKGEKKGKTEAGARLRPIPALIRWQILFRVRWEAGGGGTAEAHRLDTREKIAIICASLGVIYALGKTFFLSHITCFLGFSLCGRSDRSRWGILAEKPERGRERGRPAGPASAG